MYNLQEIKTNYGTIVFIAANGEELICDATMQISRQYTIVATPLVGRTGSVKEYVQAEDYQVEITITIGNENQQNPDYPNQELRHLIDFFERNSRESLKVQNEYLQLFSIEMLAIQAQNLSQSTHSNKQQITLSCISDTPYEIQAMENAN